MKLLVILILVGREVSGVSKVSPKAGKTETKIITPFDNRSQNEKTEPQQEILNNHQKHLPNDEIPKTQLHVTSEEIIEKPKRERETDKDFLKNVIKEILSYDKFKRLVLRDSNARNKGLHFGIQIGYNENESESATHEKVPVDSVSEEPTYDGVRSILPTPRIRQKTYQGHYVPWRSKGVSRQADQEKDNNFHSSKDNIMEFSKILKKYDKNSENVNEGLNNMAMALTKYLQYSKMYENDKNLGDSNIVTINKKANKSKQNVILKVEIGKDLVNRIISEIKLLLATHKDKSKLYVSRILDIITRKQDFLISHPNQACEEAKINYLIHSLNIVYQKYLRNAQCEGEYLDKGLKLIGWISSNKKHIKVKRELASNKGDENEANNGLNKNRYQSSPDYTSGEVRTSDGFKNRRKKKSKHVKRLSPSDDSEELESDGDHQDPNKELLDLYIKSRQVRPLHSTIFHRPHRYYRKIKKLFTKRENANMLLNSIHLVCEKIASEQFLHSVKTIIWRLLENRVCKLGNASKDENLHVNVIKPLYITNHQVEQKPPDANSFEESSEYDTPYFNDISNLSDESSLAHNTEFEKSGHNNDDSYSNYDAVPLKFNRVVIPNSKINKRFRDLTHLRKDNLRNIFGLGKINSLKVIKQKLKDLNINDYKKLMENVPVVEKLLKIIYNKLPPQLQMVLKVLKTGATKMIEDKNFSVKKIPSLLMEAFLKGKGKDLLKMMEDKYKHEKSKKVGKLSGKFQDKTRLRDIVQSVSKLANNKKNNPSIQLQEKPETSQLDTLPYIELSSSIEQNDQPVVELTYVFNHQPLIHYKPKFFVKYNIGYDQYLKNIKNIYDKDLISTGNQIQLVRVIKKEGNDSQVFYETDVPNATIEVSNKLALLKLYDQFYNSTKHNDKKSSSAKKARENYDSIKRSINEVLKSMSPAVNDEFHPTISTVPPMVSLKETTEFQSADVKTEDTVDSTSKNNNFSIKRNDSRSEEVFFDSAKSAEVDDIIMEKPIPRLSNMGREGLIQWNNYPIKKLKYSNRRKSSKNRQNRNELPEKERDFTT